MIFIDSSFIIALAIEKDQWHQKALQIRTHIDKKQYITSTFMISEALTHIGSKAGGKIAKTIYDYTTNAYEIIHPPKNMFLNIIDKFLQYDGTLSYADILTLEIMETHNIDTIVSFDSDFDKVQGIKRIH